MSSSSHTNLTRHTHAPIPPGMCGKDKIFWQKSAKKPIVAMRRTAGSESTVASKLNVSRGNVLKRTIDTPIARYVAEARYKTISAGSTLKKLRAVTAIYTNVTPPKFHPDLESTYEKAFSFSAFLFATKSPTRTTVALRCTPPGGAGRPLSVLDFCSGDPAGGVMPSQSVDLCD